MAKLKNIYHQFTAYIQSEHCFSEAVLYIVTILSSAKFSQIPSLFSLIFHMIRSNRSSNEYNITHWKGSVWDLIVLHLVKRLSRDRETLKYWKGNGVSIIPQSKSIVLEPMSYSSYSFFWIHLIRNSWVASLLRLCESFKVNEHLAIIFLILAARSSDKWA